MRLRLDVELIDHKRLVMGLTKKALAEKAGLRQQLVYDIYSGKGRHPRVIADVCKALKLDPAIVWRRNGEGAGK